MRAFLDKSKKVAAKPAVAFRRFSLVNKEKELVLGIPSSITCHVFLVKNLFFIFFLILSGKRID